jgi:methionyl-tRNA synthetase
MKYYLTTPIYYVNAAPHIGHAYTTIVADLIKRFKTMQGYRAVLTTGSDEHGVNVERAAARAGKAPAEFVAVIAREFEQQWRTLGLGVDRFMRTSDPRHHRKVAELFEACRRNGYVYKGEYRGQYCIHDNLYVSEAAPGDPCPECGRPTETVTEENYFFRLSAFEDRLLELYERQPDFILPETRRNEVISFVRQGLSDLSITRTNIKWGIPVPGEERHVFYVWFDALTTYISAVDGEDLWPADLHLIGKEIVRFHAVYWPAFLMAAGWPLPKRIFAHGWLLFQEDKMSKSKGNIVRATPIQQVMGIDALRYFLLREIVFGQDGNFSYDALVGRYNADLANGLGNLTSRTLSMIQQYRGGRIPAPAGGVRPEIAQAAENTIRAAVAHLENFEFSRALEAIWSLLSAIDRFIVEEAPWKLARSSEPGAAERLDSALYTAAEALRVAAILLWPVMPASAERIWDQLGMEGPLEQFRLRELAWGQLPAGQAVKTPEALFPRIEPRQAIERMRELEAQETARQAALFAPKPSPAPAPATQRISIEEFARIDMRVGEVRFAERVKGSDKLLHLKVDIGEPQPRTIVAGIAEAYAPESLIGRKVVIVANLQPRKLRGIESDGMIVAATPEGGKPVLVGFLEDVPPGARLS